MMKSDATLDSSQAFTTEAVEDTEVDLNTITERIIGAAIEVHKVLGPDLWSRPARSVYVESWRCAASALRGSCLVVSPLVRCLSPHQFTNAIEDIGR